MQPLSGAKPEVDRREGIRGFAGRLIAACRAEVGGIRRRGGPGRRGRQEAAALDDAVFGQVAELHVAESLPWADHCEVGAEALHAGDVVAEAAEGRSHEMS